LPKENVPKLIRDIDIEKYASPALTVSEGGEITYTVKLTSRARKRAHLVVQDALPENTVLVSGDFAAEGSVLSAKVELKAKESQTLSYTVRLGEAYTSGTYVNAPAAAIGEKKTGECKNLVAKTLMGEDRERMRDAILALSYSEDITPVKLLCDMYLVSEVRLVYNAELVPKTLLILFVLGKHIEVSSHLLTKEPFHLAFVYHIR